MATGIQGVAGVNKRCLGETDPARIERALLQTESCLDIFFRPWPKHPAEMGGDNFYAIHDRDKVADLEHLRSYQTREDIGVYQTVVMEVFKLFGEGIQESLARTMGDYLEATGGVLANSKKRNGRRTSRRGCFPPTMRQKALLP